MLITSTQTAEAQGSTDVLGDDAVRQARLVETDRDHASGRIDIIELPRTAEHQAGLDGVEYAIVVLDGSGSVRVDDETTALGRGALVQASGSRPVRLHAGEEGLTVIRVAGLALAERPAESTPTVRIVADIDTIEDNPFHAPEQGFLNMSARWLVDSDNGASSTFTLGQSTFAPGNGSHELHRHPSAQELFYVWEGEGAHLTEDGTEHPMTAGEMVFVPNNEWHGFRNTGTRPLRAIFGYLGVESLDAGGYELP